MTDRVLISQLTPEERDALCNGCGPSGWKRHSWRWWLARWFTPDLYEDCQQHDLDYEQGGDEEDRIAGDHSFREAIAQRAEEKPIVGWLLEAEQPILFDLVETEGRAHFAYGERRTLVQLKQLAHHRIAVANGDAA